MFCGAETRKDTTNPSLPRFPRKSTPGVIGLTDAIAKLALLGYLVRTLDPVLGRLGFSLLLGGCAAIKPGQYYEGDDRISSFPSPGAL